MVCLFSANSTLPKDPEPSFLSFSYFYIIFCYSDKFKKFDMIFKCLNQFNEKDKIQKIAKNKNYDNNLIFITFN